MRKETLDKIAEAAGFIAGILLTIYLSL